MYEIKLLVDQPNRCSNQPKIGSSEHAEMPTVQVYKPRRPEISTDQTIVNTKVSDEGEHGSTSAYTPHS